MTTSYELPTNPGFSSSEIRYRADLVEEIIKKLSLSAQMGWTPQDLRHELKVHVDPLLNTVINEQVGAIPPELFDYWWNQTTPDPLPMPSVTTLQAIINGLNQLEPLPDWPLLPSPFRSELDCPAFADTAHYGIRLEISRLLKNAESTNLEAEAQHLLMEAEKHYQRLRCETLLRRSYNSTSLQEEKVIAKRIYLSAPWVRKQFQLLFATAAAYDCGAWIFTKSGIATVIGVEDDVIHVAELFESLNRQRERFMKLMSIQPVAHSTESTSSLRRTFMSNYTAQMSEILFDAFKSVLSELEKEAPNASQSLHAACVDRRNNFRLSMPDFYSSRNSWEELMRYAIDR